MLFSCCCNTKGDGTFVITVRAYNTVLLSDVAEDLEKGLAEYEKKFHGFPKRIDLFIQGKVTSVEEAFLKKLTTLKELRFDDPKSTVPFLPFMKDNEVVVVGDFESAAEEFALTNDLRFRPLAGFCFAEAEDKSIWSRVKVSIDFKNNRSLELKMDFSDPTAPSDAPHGGRYVSLGDLKSLTAQDIVEAFGPLDDSISRSLARETHQSAKLERFLRCLKTHKYYLGPY